MVTQKIADVIKKTLDGFDEKKMHDQMQRHYKLFHLMDETGKWVTPELQKISSEWLPSDVTKEKSKAFVDEIAQIAEQNPYLVKFLEKTENYTFKRLAEKSKKEGNQVLSDMVAYSLVLEYLTKAMYDDYRMLRICIETFEKAKKESNSFRHISWKHKIKLISIEGPVKKVLLKAHDTGIVPEDAGSLIFPFNIMEAVFVEYIEGDKENAKVGCALARHRPGSKEYDPQTGAGPSAWSEDKKAIACSPPLSKEWTDLYQTWNLAFASRMGDYPYVLPKLLIPQVANYQKDPRNYIYSRVLALYLCLYYIAFLDLENIKMNKPELQWNDKKLTRFWGKINLESLREYKSELAKVKGAKSNNKKPLSRLLSSLMSFKKRGV